MKFKFWFLRYKKIILPIAVPICSLATLGLLGFILYISVSGHIRDFDGIDLEKCDKLMIVAHADDETIWGGGHLIDDGDYLVVLVTCGQNSLNKVRSREVARAVKKTGNQLLNLGYITGTMRSKSSEITLDLQRILSMKEWSLIVTHNPDGEYEKNTTDHTGHRFVSNLVTEVVPKENFWYFGVYYKREEIAVIDQPKLETDTLKKKMKVLDVYFSQRVAVEKHWHMLPYEVWVKYEEWG